MLLLPLDFALILFQQMTDIQKLIYKVQIPIAMKVAIHPYRHPVLEIFTTTYWDIVKNNQVRKEPVTRNKKEDEIHILLADDDNDDREFFMEAMSESIPNAVVTTAKNGMELMSTIIEKKDRLPDIIFLDLNMPCKNGQECLKEIKKMQQFKNIPVVMYSTSSTRADVENAYKEGANLYVKKPNSYAELKKIASKITSLVQAMRMTNA
ncbi:MAG: response regulator [Bacteroidetes bacterium]|nr:response regulator [Bacteroidota bacterium]